MGVDLVNALKLLELREKTKMQGRLLQIGRQGFHVRRGELTILQEQCEKLGVAFDIEAIRQNNMYSEPFFEALGFDHCESVDASDFEGCTYVHDMNTSPPDRLVGRYDFVLDGGTTEHIFNVPSAFNNVFRFLKTNGYFYSVNGANGYFGHGFYQFSPELPWSFWHRNCGLEVIDCVAMPANHTVPSIAIPDPKALGKRAEPRLPPGRVYLCYTVQKTARSKWRVGAQQSDYVAQWVNAS
ncbi:MAG: hypothetical protein AAF755_04690 [Pseudomonadota bacterium]